MAPNYRGHLIMKKTLQFKPVSGSSVLIVTLVMGLCSASPPLRADGAGAFLGGMIASRVLNNMSERTEAEQAQPAAATRQSSGGTRSVEERIHTLDQLRANGTISKSDYESRKKAILDSI
jgi:hypothetical protein